MALNLLYLDITGLVTPPIYTGSISINYERQLLSWLSLQAGYGHSSTAGVISSSANARGVEFSLKWILRLYKANHLALGSGVSYMSVSHPPQELRACEEREDYERCNKGYSEKTLTPSLALSYRYHPKHAGLFFQSGLAFHYYYGALFSIALGFGF